MSRQVFSAPAPTYLVMKHVTAVLLVLLVLPLAGAQINGPRDYEAAYAFSDPDQDAYINVISGEPEVHVDGSGGPFVFFDTAEWSVESLHKVCYLRTVPPLKSCVEGDVSIVMSAGGDAAIEFGLPSEGTYTADHALAMFLTQRGDDVNGLQLDQSVLLPSINGQMTFTSIPDVAAFLAPGAPSGFLVPASDDSEVLILKDGVPVQTIEGKNRLEMYGSPSIAPFTVTNAILPFKEGSDASFVPAEPTAAAEGLDPNKIAQLLSDLAAASENEREGDSAPDNPVQESLSEVLDAAMLRLPNPQAQNTSADGFSMVLFETLQVRNTGAPQLAYAGDAALQYEDGEIVGAQELYGVWYIQLPWWGWALWVVAIGLFIARLASKPDKHHEKWDQYKWVGWVAGAVTLLLVLFLCDLEMRSVWGTSVLTSDTSGTAFWVTFAAQFLITGLVLGVVAWPVNIIVKNGLLLARQGTFMGLGKPIGLLLAYLLGATLFLAYLELVVQAVVANA